MGENYARKTRQRSSFKQHPLANGQCGKGGHLQTRSEHGQDRSHLLLFDRLRNSPEAHYMYNAWHGQNRKTI
jgi:hypothetical protein